MLEQLLSGNLRESAPAGGAGWPDRTVDETRPVARAAMRSKARGNYVRCVGLSFMGDVLTQGNHASWTGYMVQTCLNALAYVYDIVTSTSLLRMILTKNRS